MLLMMNVLCLILMMTGSIVPGVAPSHFDNDADQVYNVMDYGAFGIGFIDSSQAFQRAWNAACNSDAKTAEVLVPENAFFLVFPTTFQGPCKPEKIIFKVLGTILGPNAPIILFFGSRSQWLVFQGVRGLSVEGSGTIDGQGVGWWYQSCKISPQLAGCTYVSPTAMQFLGCNESSLNNLVFTNSPQTHILIMNSEDFTADQLTIRSPGNSPNTDGIHIHASHHISITNSVIGTGDDCISIGDYNSDIDISNITCGPGHGISIGSLGRNGNFAKVSNIRVSNSFFTGSTNGARIKTWQVGKGYVRQIKFQNLQFDNVRNPIIIDQNYCDVGGDCEGGTSGVQISNVTYMTMSGTSSTDIAINLNCSRFVPCTGIMMEDIRLTSATESGEVRASCTNAQGREENVVPGHCLDN